MDHGLIAIGAGIAIAIAAGLAALGIGTAAARPLTQWLDNQKCQDVFKGCYL